MVSHAPDVVAVLLFLFLRGFCHRHLPVCPIHHVDHRENPSLVACIKPLIEGVYSAPPHLRRVCREP